jgi:hypothetical protein
MLREGVKDFDELHRLYKLIKEEGGSEYAELCRIGSAATISRRAGNTTPFGQRVAIPELDIAQVERGKRCNADIPCLAKEASRTGYFEWIGHIETCVPGPETQIPRKVRPR